MANDQQSRQRREKKKRQHELQRKRKKKRTSSPVKPGEVVVGFTARRGLNMLCDEEQCCVITHNRSAMKQFIENHGLSVNDYVIESTSSSHILRVLSLGGKYAVDQQSYRQLLPIANANGKDWQPLEFQEPTDEGICLVRLGAN